SARPGNWGRELDPLRHWDHGAPPGCSTGDGGRVRAVEPVLPEWLAPAAQAGLRRSGPAWWRCRPRLRLAWVGASFGSWPLRRSRPSARLTGILLHLDGSFGQWRGTAL